MNMGVSGIGSVLNLFDRGFTRCQIRKVPTALFLICIASTGLADVEPQGLTTLSSQPPYRYDFQLEKGEGVPVCEAYLERLRKTDFYTIPHCDRPENVSVAGFEKLNRMPLTKEEILSLFEDVEGLLIFNDLGFKKIRAHSISQKREFKSGAEEAATWQAERSKEGYPESGDQLPYYYRFVPPIDVDNDGSPDSVIVWKDHVNRCGGFYEPRYDYPWRERTFLVILNERGGLDIEKTRALIGHPLGDGFPYRNPKTGETKTITVPFRKIGKWFGVFEYEGQYYIDTFYSDGLDYENKPFGEAANTDLLAVLRRAAGVTHRVCEIRWNDCAQRSMN